jgi:hypothetical protein
MLNERKLTKPELAKREDIVMDMKKNKRKLVKRYGKDAEKVMYGRATNMAKKQTENMDDKNLNLRKMIEDALQNPRAAYEKTRGAAIEKNMKKVDEMEMRAAKMKADKFAGSDPKAGSTIKGRGFDWDKNTIKIDKLKKTRGAAIEKNLTEDKSEAAYELQEIMDQLYELSDRAKQIIRSEFPSEYSRLDAYGALDFGTSSNRYDITFEKALENLDMEDDDMDMMQEDLDLVHVYDVDGTMYGTGERVSNKGDKTLVRFDGATEKEFPSSQVKNVSEDLDLGHQDDEPGMLKGDLYKIGKYSMELYQMMDSLEGMGEVDLPHWWQSKITTAKNMISGAKHYLDFEMKEPQIDAMVNVAAEEDIINEAAGKFVVRPCTAKDTPWAVWQTSEGGENDKRIEGFKTKEDAQNFADKRNSMNEIGMFLDPIGYEKTAPKKEIFTKKYVSPGVYDIFKNGKKVKTIKGEGEANAWMNQARREMNEGMSEKEWAEATEKANLSKLKDSDQDKIKKIVAMLKAEKKPKK